MANLTVTISENMLLPNKNREIATNTIVIPDVNQFVRRIDTISHTFEGDGIGIVSFVSSEAEQTPGSFVNTDVKYIRITNLAASDTFATITCIKTNEESVSFTIYPGRSLILSSSDFDASQAGDYVAVGYVDEQYYTDLTYMSLIKAKAGNSNSSYTGTIQLEYIIASS